VNAPDLARLFEDGPGALAAAGLAHLAPLAALEPADRDLLARAQVVRAPAKATIFAPGDACVGFVLVLSGEVRVTRVTAEGRELVLYRIGPGESCVLTTACLMAGEDHAAEATAVRDVEALLLPTADFHRLMDRARPFRDFVFATFGARLVRLTDLLEGIAYGRLDVRLARLLLERAGQDAAIATTHQELANELGSAREVISRRLEALADGGLVALSRGRVEVLDRERLEKTARG